MGHQAIAASCMVLGAACLDAETRLGDVLTRQTGTGELGEDAGSTEARHVAFPGALGRHADSSKRLIALGRRASVVMSIRTDAPSGLGPRPTRGEGLRGLRDLRGACGLPVQGHLRRAQLPRFVASQTEKATDAIVLQSEGTRSVNTTGA